MISLPSSPTFTSSRSISGKPNTENENPAVSPKRSFAQLEEDQSSQLDLKRRVVQPSRRGPLDPLSASDLENRRGRGSQLSDSAAHHTLVTASPVSDLRVLHPRQTVSSGSCGMQRSGISDALVCSWPPPTSTLGTARSPHSGLAGQQPSQCGPLHCPDKKNPSRATFPESTSTWDTPNSFPTEPTTMTKPSRTTGWKSDDVLQPIRSRINSMPSIRRPPGELWRSDSASTRVVHVHVDAYPTPPGLPSPRPELRRGSTHPDLHPHGSLSLSLAHGSQPLRASEHTKAVPPIGAERSRVASITSSRLLTRNSPATQSHHLSKSPWCLSPLSPYLPNTASMEKLQAADSNASVSKEYIERLLRHAVWNKYAPKITSTLSPLRTTTAVLNLSSDPAYQSRIPSEANNLSPRYSKCPPRRARTICDGYQSLDWDATCMHCQECKRDTVGKRLLAFRYRQQQTWLVQRNRLLTYPFRAATASVMNDDRIVLANRMREVFAYEMDEEEKSLWEEVAAVTGVEPLSFSRVGTPCGATAHRRVMDEGNDDGAHDDYMETLDEGFLANESGTLFRDVSVY